MARQLRGCVFVLPGCTDVEAVNYNPAANQDDGGCRYESAGCNDVGALNYDSVATAPVGCSYRVIGCTDSSSRSYAADANADIDVWMAELQIILTAKLDSSTSYDGSNSSYDGSNSSYDGSNTSYNYGRWEFSPEQRARAQAEVAILTEYVAQGLGRCIYVMVGCMAREAVNYDSLATRDD
eukprot:7346452-Prymnesium_polylepis.1